MKTVKTALLGAAVLLGLSNFPAQAAEPCTHAVYSARTI